MKIDHSSLADLMGDVLSWEDFPLSLFDIADGRDGSIIIHDNCGDFGYVVVKGSDRTNLAEEVRDKYGAEGYRTSIVRQDRHPKVIVVDYQRADEWSVRE